MLTLFPTCTFLGAAWFLAVHSQLAPEVLLPELSEPYVPAVIGQRAALEVTVKCCGKKQILRLIDLFQNKILFCNLFTCLQLTVNRCPLGKNGDGALSHLLLPDHRRDLGAPTVRAYPQEVPRQVVAFCRIQDPPVSGATNDS